MNPGRPRAVDVTTDRHPGDAGDAPSTAVGAPVRLSAPPVACTLDEPEMLARLQGWQELLRHVGGRSTIDGGVRLDLDATTPVDELALLVRAEQACCAFLAFTITFDGRGVGLEVRAPAEAQTMVRTMFGTAG